MMNKRKINEQNRVKQHTTEPDDVQDFMRNLLKCGMVIDMRGTVRGVRLDYFMLDAEKGFNR